MEKRFELNKEHITIAEEMGLELDDINSMSIVSYFMYLMNRNNDAKVDGIIIDKQERFVNSARKWASILSHGADTNVPYSLATSSTMEVLFYIFKSDIETLGIKENLSATEREITIPTDIVFETGDYNFRLDYPIIIKRSDINSLSVSGEIRNTHRFTAEYDLEVMNREPNTVSNIQSPTIEVRQVYFRGREAIALRIRVRESTKTVNEKTHIDEIATAIFEIPYEDTLEAFDVYFKDPGDSRFRKLNTALFAGSTSAGETLFYILKEKSIVFMNKYMSGGFFPMNGGQYRIITYTTNAVNFSKYTGTTNVSAPPEVELEMYFESMTGASGAINRMGIEDYRKHIIDMNSTRGSIIKVSDIRSHYQKYGDVNTIYAVNKYRDDFFDRIISVMVTLRSSAGLIPTNTGNVLFDEGNLFVKQINPIDKYWSLPFGKVIKAFRNQYRDDPEFVLGDKDDESTLSYICPYQICIDVRRNYAITYEAYKNKHFTTRYLWANKNSPTNFSINSVHFYKRVESDIYTFRMNVSPTNPGFDKGGEYTIDGVTEKFPEFYAFHQSHRDNWGNEFITEGYLPVFSDGSKPEFPIKHLHVAIVMVENNRIIAYVDAGMISYDVESKEYIFEANLKLNTPVLFNKINVKGLNPGTFEENDIELNVDQTQFYINVHMSDTGRNSDSDQDMSTDDPHLNLHSIIVDKGRYSSLITSNVFSIEGAKLFEELTELIPFQLGNRAADHKSLTVFNVPLIREEVFIHNQDSIFESLNRETELIDSLYDLKENNFKCRLLFANTYGLLPVGLNSAISLNIGERNEKVITSFIRMSVSASINKYSDLTPAIIGKYIYEHFLKIDFYNGEYFHWSRLVDELYDTFTREKLYYIELNEIFSQLDDTIVSYKDTELMRVRINNSVDAISIVPNIELDKDGNPLIEVLQTV